MTWYVRKLNYEMGQGRMNLDNLDYQCQNNVQWHSNHVKQHDWLDGNYNILAWYNWTHHKSNADIQLFFLHHIHNCKERYDWHQDQWACPHKIEYDWVQPGLDQPFDLNLSCIHCVADPLVLPCKELDKLDLIYTKILASRQGNNKVDEEDAQHQLTHSAPPPYCHLVLPWHPSEF